MEPCAVITVSDRAAAGEREDLSGPVIAEALVAAGYTATVTVVPDGEPSVAAALHAALAAGARLVVTTGGTGVGPRDRTPEATRAVLDRELPGVAELLRAEGRTHSAHAALTRGLVGVTAGTDSHPPALIANLPGSPKAAREGVDVLLPLVRHILDQLDGGDH
jgi:molybdenum cofactor synthesis domain-containing protein